MLQHDRRNFLKRANSRLDIFLRDRSALKCRCPKPDGIARLEQSLPQSSPRLHNAHLDGIAADITGAESYGWLAQWTSCSEWIG